MATGIGTPHETSEANRVYTKTPADMSAMRLRFQDDVESDALRSLSFGIPDIDEHVNTLWPGRLTTIVARPSNWKTSLMVHLARLEAKRIMAAGTGDRECVFFATLEEDEVDVHQSITGDATVAEMLRGAYDRDHARQRSRRAVEWPVFMLGLDPVDRAAAVLGDELPQLTVQQIYREIVQVDRDLGVRPSVILVDYAQILDVEGDKWGDRRNDNIGIALRNLKKVGKAIGAHVIVALQAKEDADKRRPPVPEGQDVFYSSEALHASDIMLSLYYPCRYPATVHDGWVSWQGDPYPVTENLLWVQLLKQRKGRGRKHWLVACDPVRQSVGPIELLTVGGQRRALETQKAALPVDKPKAPPVNSYIAASLPAESEDIPW